LEPEGHVAAFRAGVAAGLIVLMTWILLHVVKTGRVP
jgi:hypothetical protein